MDFTLSDEQTAISELAHRILSEKLPPERLRELEDAGTWYAEEAWAELAKAGLLGIALPTEHGGGGFGILEACLVAEQVGRAAAPLPYLSTVVGAGLPIAEMGTPEQRSAHLPGLADGTALVTVALHEQTVVTVPSTPQTKASRAGEGWRLDGEKCFVVAADRATTALVPAATGAGTTTVFLVDLAAGGVTKRAEQALTGEPQFTVRFDGVEVPETAVLGAVDGGAEVTGRIADLLLGAVCATQIGVCEEALAITARYVSTREQFGSRLGTFQAVGHRVADAYIDTEAIRLTTLQAVWRLATGLDAARELMVAKFWAAEGAQRVVHAAQHLHGGIGMDRDYPVHRYFRWAKVLELTLGGATPSLLHLGRELTGPKN